MDSELLMILDQIERDKGVNKEILIQAVESAVASAVKKIWTVGKEQEIQVILDRKSGKLIAYADGEEIKSKDFGRIAAQTAKQVVIQKIREAEKDVVFSEYHARIGQIVTGSVYRIDKGNIIVDLSKTEAFIPRSEQSGKEEFKQGDRIRAYILDVRRETKGPQIVLSRAHPNFVKRLFELEVPEIYDGIVEVKGIARDAGERTKIAVYSKEEKIDCVGACVGMRGSRVKGIVTELHGEKIDIVRYSEDKKTYIQAALSPAEISQMHLYAQDKRADIIVADDQLSIAIGKHGQNIRLASQLVGWQLEVFSETQWKEHADKLPQKEVKTTAEEGGTAASEIAELSGVGKKLVELLTEKGFDTLKKIAQSSVDELSAIKGLGKVKAEKIIKEAKALAEKK